MFSQSSRTPSPSPSPDSSPRDYQSLLPDAMETDSAMGTGSEMDVESPRGPLEILSLDPPRKGYLQLIFHNFSFSRVMNFEQFSNMYNFFHGPLMNGELRPMFNEAISDRNNDPTRNPDVEPVPVMKEGDFINIIEKAFNRQTSNNWIVFNHYIMNFIDDYKESMYRYFDLYCESSNYLMTRTFGYITPSKLHELFSNPHIRLLENFTVDESDDQLESRLNNMVKYVNDNSEENTIDFEHFKKIIDKAVNANNLHLEEPEIDIWKSFVQIEFYNLIYTRHRQLNQETSGGKRNRLSRKKKLSKRKINKLKKRKYSRKTKK